MTDHLRTELEHERRLRLYLEAELRISQRRLAKHDSRILIDAVIPNSCEERIEQLLERIDGLEKKLLYYAESRLPEPKARPRVKQDGGLPRGMG